MKKDFFGGRDEIDDTIYSFCGEDRCLDPSSCEGCGRLDTATARAAIVDAVLFAEAGTAALPPPIRDWGYQADNGPHTWHRQFPVAALGAFQSPIDLCERDVGRSGGSLPPLITCFQPAVGGLAVENTGASWQINWPRDDMESACVLRGGPLLAGEEYHLLQLHAHWGAARGRGSEHTLEGRSLDGELHLVFYNRKYQPEEAMEAPDGLAVVGLFLRQQDNDDDEVVAHPELEKITRQLAAVQMRGQTAYLDEVLSVGDLLPPVTAAAGGGRAYFSYPGSLTTPPLYESVTWIVMREPLSVSGRQLDMMRGMRSGEREDSAPIVDNFRPACCRGRRSLRAAF